MVKKTEFKNKNVYQCQECGFHYLSEETAKRCENWCKENQSCNLEIIREALENKEIEEK